MPIYILQWAGLTAQASRRLAEKLTCGKRRIKIRKNSSQKIMNDKNAKNSTGIIAGITGLLFALLYTGLEILTENPDATHSISIWHTPLIWLLAGIFFYLVLYAVGTIRGGKVKERMITFSLCVVAAILLALFWVYPMISGLMQCFGGSGC
jgi:glucose-6-phosphate-specific signal transduction histidine kinase